MAPPENELPLAVDTTQGQIRNTQPTRNVNPREIGRCSAWLWAEKAVIRRIREVFDELPFLDQALAVYLVLCEVSSDQQDCSFTIRKRVIAERCGVSLRRVTEVLSIFKNLDLLTWKQNSAEGCAGLGANTYTLLALGAPCTTSGTVGPTSGTACPTLGVVSTTLGKNAKSENCADIEETEEIIEENIEERPSVAEATPAPPQQPRNDEAWLAELKADPAYSGIDVQREFAKMRRWCMENRKQPTRRRFINWLNRTDRPLSTRGPAATQPNHSAGF